MDLQALKYINYATSIVLRHLILLILPIAVGYFIFIEDPEKVDVLSYFYSLVLLFLYTPVAFGYFFENVVNKQRLSLFEIFKKHWLNVTIILLLIGLSCVFLIFFLSAIINPNLLIGFFVISINIITLYIIPLVFYMGRDFKTISLGLKCLFGNIAFNSPLIILSMVPIILNVLIYKITGKEVNSIEIHMFKWVWLIIIDYILFVSALLILEDKVLKKEE